VSVDGVRDPWGTFRLMRISVVRDLLRTSADTKRTGGAAAEPWQETLELLREASAHARRVETVTVAPRFDVRQRPTRRDPWPDAWQLLRNGWAARGRKRVPAAT
jgi:hypothetical protein